MFNLKCLVRMAILVIGLGLPLGMAAAQDIPQPPVPLAPGESFANPNPGIAAPAENSGTVGTQAVSGSRGYGDVSFSWFANNVTAHATTWLSQSAPGTHNICARLITMDVNGNSVGSHANYKCESRTAGQSVDDTVTGYAACGSFIGARSLHKIEQPGYYFWESPEDSDFIPNFCN